jgi:outer membrane biosynthesis protein TonB
LFGATVLSAVLHAAAIVATVVAWPYVAPEEFPSDIVPVEMVDLAEETNIAPQEEQKESPEPAPEPQQLAMPQMAPPQPVFEPPPPEDDAPALEEDTKPEEPPKPTPQRFAAVQPRVKPKPEPPKKDDAKAFDDMMKGLNLDEQPKKKEPPAQAKKQEARVGAGAQSALTMDEVAALKGRLAKCWNVPVGAPDPASLVFRVRFSLNQDGTVASPPQLLDQGRLGDPYFRAAADAAIRAINICGPYELPVEKYAGAGGWNEITIEFDPTKMAGY